MTGMIVAGLIGVPWRVVGLIALLALVWGAIGFASIDSDEENR